VLGTMDSDERQLVLADIPGLIEGAAAGAGLGHEFLAHVERCRLLLHLVSLGGEIGAGEPAPEEAYATVRGELEAHGTGLERLPEVIVLSKRDLVPPERVEALVAQWQQRMDDSALGVLAVSSATGEGLETLTRRVFELLPPAAPEARDAVIPEGEAFEAEHMVYAPAGDGGFEVVREGAAFRVAGRGIEMLVERHDLSNLEALAYLEQRLREIGVIAALERAGFTPGDEVRIGAEEFELH
jgi:GTPase